jgi:hypothetical protein
MPKDIGLLAKVILLSMPAVVLLVLWGRRGVRSKTNYVVSWVNAVASWLWLVAAISKTVPSAVLFVFCPFFLGIVSACMLVWPGAAGEERKYQILANVLMLIFWAFTIAVPN